ncbi:WxL domain-containing protein [Lactococcus petauri]|uniref:WxL domain-containing protein n=1 Tax=Lactococcus petauri TaxID=1940789 RepID=UPI0013FD1DA3|nr:WxL domain-containing protein [Lactococcus petauri]NHI76403.1 WxL domain-containing protein [Lactococcus petauri]
MKKYTKTGAILTILLGFLAFQNFPLFESNKVKATTTISGSLVPGESSDTGNHVLDSNFQRNKDNWTVLAGNDSWWKWNTNNYFYLANSKKNSWVYHVIDVTIDFSQPVSISTPYWYDKAGEWKWGDGAGFFLTPETEETILKNAPNAVGQYLGIQGLPNSYFIGRDPWYNNAFDGPDDKKNSGQDTLEIRKTKSDGTIEHTATSTLPWTEVSAPIKFKSEFLSSNYYGSEMQTMTWQDIIDNKNGTYTGTLSITSIPDPEYNNGGKYGPVTASRRVTLNRKMTFGSLGITGSNTGVIQEGNATDKASFSAMRGTRDIKVNYIDAVTNEPIKGADSSIITANTGDLIGVTDGTTNNEDDYDYQAPNFEHYNFKQGESVLVETDEGTTETKSEINVYYTPDIETAIFKTYYVKGTPGTGLVTDSITGIEGAIPESSISFVEGKSSLLPTTDPSTVSGYYNNPIGVIPKLDIPVGYEIDRVVGPDGKGGKSYPDLSSALAANSSFEDSAENSWANYFSIYLKAKEAAANFTYKYIEGTRPNAPVLPDTLTQKGLMGGVIRDPSNDLAELPSGSSIQNFTGPDGKNYSSLMEALSAENNMYYESSSKTFVINVVAPPVSVNIEDAPELDFGVQVLKAKPIYDMIPKSPLTVIDDTATDNGWVLTADLTQQFKTNKDDVIDGATLKFSKAKITPGDGNTAETPVTSEFTLSESGAVIVSTAESGSGQGKWHFIFPNISLNTYGSALKINQNYQATIEWGISNVPQ